MPRRRAQQPKRNPTNPTDKLATELRALLIKLCKDATSFTDQEYSAIDQILTSRALDTFVLLYTGKDQQAASTRELNALHLAAKAAVFDNTQDRKALNVLEKILASPRCTNRVHLAKGRYIGNPFNLVHTLRKPHHTDNHAHHAMRAILASHGCEEEVLTQSGYYYTSVVDVVFEKGHADVLKIILGSKLASEALLHEGEASLLKKARCFSSFGCLDVLAESDFLNPIEFVKEHEAFVKRHPDYSKHKAKIQETFNTLFNKALASIQQSDLPLEQKQAFDAAAKYAYEKANFQDKQLLLTAVSATDRLINKKATSSFAKEMSEYQQIIHDFSNSHQSWAKPLAQAMAAIFLGVLAVAAVVSLVVLVGVPAAAQLPLVSTLIGEKMATIAGIGLFSGVASGKLAQYALRNKRHYELNQSIEAIERSRPAAPTP